MGWGLFLSPHTPTPHPQTPSQSVVLLCVCVLSCTPDCDTLSLTTPADIGLSIKAVPSDYIFDGNYCAVAGRLHV